MKFIETQPELRQNLMLVDFLNVAFRWRQTGKSFSAEYCNTVSSLAKSYKARKVIICADYGSKYRKGIYPEYKGNRDKPKTEEEKLAWEFFLDQCNITMDILKQMYPVLKIPGVEADDIAAYIATHNVDEFEHIWLISSDKDWDLLINDKVSRFSTVTRKEITLENWDTHYDYPVDKHLDIKVLMGDSGDNVPGIPGVGPKRAATLVEQYGSAIDLMESIPIEGKAKYIQAVNEFKDNIELNLQLMDLISYSEEALLGADNIALIDKALHGDIYDGFE